MILRRSLKSSKMKWVFLGALFLTFHYSFTVYINSNFLSQFFDTTTIGHLYIVGSIITAIGLIASSSIIKRIGNFRFLLTLLIIEIVALFTLFSTHDLSLIKGAFVFHEALPALLAFSLDVYLEGLIEHENQTGKIRSLYLTMMNVAFLFSPLIVGNIVTAFSYRAIYLISGSFCILLLLLILDEFRNIPHKSLKEISFTDSIKKFIPHRDLNRLFLINVLLQSFYALMVIYVPIYLHQTIGFSWEVIGVIFTIMLIPFVVFEAPLGRLFDSIHIEKDTFVTGFVIMSLSLIAMYFMNIPYFLLWALLLFMSRVGASFVEVAVESSFFRRVNDKDAGFISVYRLAGPLSYILVPLVVGPLSKTLPLPIIFLIAGIGILSGIVFAFNLRIVR